MSGRIASFLSLAAVAIASPLTIGAGIAIYEASAPPEASLVSSLMGRLGEGEGARANSAREAEAQYQYRLLQAQEENKRITTAYTKLYDTMGTALQRAFDLEADIVKMQARNINETQWARKFGTNLADIGCMLSMASPDSGLDGACEAGTMLRRGIVGEYQETLSDTRPRLVEDMLRDFPKPDEFLRPEYERAAQEFGGETD